MTVVSAIIIAVLTFIPYSLALVKQAGQSVALTARSSIALATPTPTPPPIVPTVPQLDVAAWYASRGEEPEKHGVLIETLDGKQTLAAHNPDETFNPASLIKLSTTLAVLHKFGADYRFETRVYADGIVDNTGTLNGNLYLDGHDPSFGDAAASLISRELRARGIKRVKEKILVTDGFSFNYSESPEDSATYVARVLQLKPAGTGVADRPAGDVQFVFKSYPLREILLYMNAHSSNFVAEHLGNLIGGPAGLEAFLKDELKLPPDQVTIERTSGRQHNRLTPRGMLIVLRSLYEETTRQGMKLEDIMPVACGDVGTLRRRLAGTPLEGAVVGKTGTLTTEVDGGMASLAGIVYTNDAGAILFAILDQGNHIGEHRQMEDDLLSEVVTKHDAPRVCLAEPRKLLPSDELQISGE